jgi:hypothetical protein
MKQEFTVLSTTATKKKAPYNGAQEFLKGTKVSEPDESQVQR